MFLVSLSHVNLFWFLLFPLSSQVNGGIENTLEKEVVRYDFYSSYFDIFVSIFSYILFQIWWVNQKANFLSVDLKICTVLFAFSPVTPNPLPGVTGTTGKRKTFPAHSVFQNVHRMCTHTWNTECSRPILCSVSLFLTNCLFISRIKKNNERWGRQQKPFWFSWRKAFF